MFKLNNKYVKNKIWVYLNNKHFKNENMNMFKLNDKYIKK